MHVLDRNAQLGNAYGGMLLARDSPDPFELIALVETRMISRNVPVVLSLLDDLIVMIAEDRSRVMRRALRHDQHVIHRLLDVVVIIVTQIVHADAAAVRMLRNLAPHDIVLRLGAFYLKRLIIVSLLILMLQSILGLESNVYRVHHLSFLDAGEAMTPVQLLQAAYEWCKILHTHFLEVDSIDLRDSFILLLLFVGRVVGGVATRVGSLVILCLRFLVVIVLKFLGK